MRAGRNVTVAADVASLLLLAIVATKVCGTVAFVTTATTIATNDVAVGTGTPERTIHRRRRRRRLPVLRDLNPNFDYDYIPPNPEASPGSFHSPWLRSSYPPGTPAGLRGEAVRSALVTTERCIGWNLSSNTETSSGGMLEISGRGTLDFLNGKLTRDFKNGPTQNSFREACLLDAKGRLIDVLKVTLTDNNRRALLLTSPGHSSAELLKRLDPFVFPMDEVSLTNFCSDDTNGDTNGDNGHQSFAFTLASTQYRHVQEVMREQSDLKLESNEMVFPGALQGVVWKPRSNHENDVQILVVPSTGISRAACVGYSFVFFGTGSTAAVLGRQTWERLTSEDNLEGPVEVGALEYETLRVEAGQPAFGREYGIDRTRQKNREPATEPAGSAPQKKKKPSDVITTSPFELHFDPLVDLDKGCYLGQEGIASVLRNPRGAPRTLYTVVFEDDFNIYEPQSRGDKSDIDNLTTLPVPGQKLFALGSNSKLEVGTLTSIGEAGGTGSRFTVGLALVKRADTIRKRMDALDLEIPRDADDFLDVDLASGSGIIQPPSMDPLEGLEVIVEGTFTVGVLKSVPNRRSGIRRNSNMYEPFIEVEEIEEYEPMISQTPKPTTASKSAATVESESKVDDLDDNDDSALTSLEQIEAEVAQATAEAEAAAAEAKRKAEKMELLKKRAEEAMARRKQKAAQKDGEAKEKSDEDAAVAEAKRKAEKMEMLKKRADEAMARRRAKKGQ